MKSSLLTLALIAYFATGEALKCYECRMAGAMDCAACNSPFDKNGACVIKTKCQPKAQCFVSTAKTNSTIEVSRGCVLRLGHGSDQLGDESIASETGKPLFVMKYCDRDLCNGASSTSFALSTITTLVGFWIFKST